MIKSFYIASLPLLVTFAETSSSVCHERLTNCPFPPFAKATQCRSSVPLNGNREREKASGSPAPRDYLT